MLEKLCKIFEEGLDKNNHAQNYLKNRGIPKRIFKEFRLGYISTKSLLDLNKNKKYSETLKESGLIKTIIGNSGEEYIIPSFGDYCIFPIIDSDKNVVGFYGRSISYAPLFKHMISKKPKGIFYNQFLLNKNKKIFLTESPIDGLTLIKNGFPSISILGINGWGRIDFNLLKDKFVYICFDNDISGNDSANRLGVILKKKKIGCKIINLPDLSLEKTDVNIYFNEIPNAKFCFTKLIESATCPIYTLQPKKFNGSLKDEKIDNYPITELVNRILGTNKSGSRFFIKCFLHQDDDKPSMLIGGKNSNFYYCFGCAKSGGNLSFIYNYFKCSSKEEAIKKFYKLI